MPRKPAKPVERDPVVYHRDAILTAAQVRRGLGNISEETFESLGIPYVNMGRGESKHRNRRYLWSIVLSHLFGSAAA